MQCPNCGAHGNGKFCEYCGSEMPKESSTTNIIDNSNNTVINNYYNSAPIKNHANYNKNIKHDKKEKKKKKQNKFYLSSIFWLIIFFPVGLILMWSKKDFTKRTRIIITTLFAILVLISPYMQDNKDKERNEKEDYSEQTLEDQKLKEDKNISDEAEIENIESNVVEENFYPRESDEIITITDYVSFWQNYSNEDMNRWYRITGRISNIGENSFTIKDGLPDNFTAMISCYFNEDVDLSAYRDGDTITFVGFSGNKLWDALMIEHCFLE